MRSAHAMVVLAVAVVLLVVGANVLTRGSGADTQRAGSAEKLATAVFAGGCFWCMEPPYDAIDGVAETTSGYIGGSTPEPTYQQVSAGRTGHAEAVRVRYDPQKVSYQRLLDVFWRNIDPFARDRQFCDVGSQYRAAVFYQGKEQKAQALASRAQVETELGKPVATEIVPASTFYEAEDYHQDYYKKNPVRYRIYRFGCRRDARLEEVWETR